MAVDNPSYFSLRSGEPSSGVDTASTSAPTTTPTTRSLGGLFRRNKSANKISSSRCVRDQPRNQVTTTAGCQRRSFRNLFRSASASADSEKTRQFLKGEPRPSDVAPPSPYLNSRSHVHSETGRCKVSRRRLPKSTNELLNMDMIFCGLPADGGVPTAALTRRAEDNDYYRFERDSECGSEATTATLPLDDVEDAPNYYNLTATLPSLGSPMYSSMGRRKQHQYQQQRRRRRHSIGTFLEGERCPVAPADTESSRDVVDHVDDGVDYPSTIKSPKADRLGTRHAPGPYPTKPQDVPGRDDVIFISSKDEASVLWVNYLTASFEQISRQQGRPPFRVSQVTFEDSLLPGTDLKIRNSRLQIVVVCPVFLERAAERPEHAALISRQLNSERVLAMMLGVQDVHLNAEHRAALITYPSWRKFFVKDQDETFVGQFLGAAVAILGTATATNLKNDKTAFSVHPKKVKLGQNRVIALLNEPLQTNDNVIVIVDRCGEAIEVSHVKRRNPYTLQFSIPDRCLEVSMLVGVRISRNGAPLGVRQVKCESRLRELDQILRAHDNPLEFMCQTFGFNPGDREQLDNWMVHSFQKNIPPHFNLLANATNDLQFSKNHSSSEENPTLLHFAARFGLEKLAWQLLECPGGEIACDMRNANDFTPADLAEQAGHLRLAHQLRGYMQMNEFSNMYSYLKVMSENTNRSANTSHQIERLTTTEEEPLEEGSHQEDYCQPRPLSEAYSVPPAARPVATNCQRNLPDYSTPPPLPQPNPSVDASTPTLALSLSASSTLDPSNLELPLQGYMQMNATALRSPNSTVSTPTGLSSSQLIVQSPSSEAPMNDTKSECCGIGSDQLSCKSSSIGRSSQASSRSRDCPQDELLEIITDFKNNVFTISEVERLVENWRNRNDVQQSFKDKQRQLSAMRDEYERIQKRIKDEMKAPTPFDRIRKFFTKGKKDLRDSAGTNDDNTSSKQNGVSNLGDRRPVSSLSLHSVSSSSSSGRMSTVSGCSGTSLGDSGTHSDTEDRRLQHPASEDKAVGITSYEIPPTPKPFHGRLQNPAAAKYASMTSRMGCPSASNSELDLRAVKSSHSTVDDKEYYIAFPPSGLPVHSFKPQIPVSVRELKTPSSPVDMSSSNSFHDLDSCSNYANLEPILKLPPGMCIPFEYANITGNSSPGPECINGNILTVQPEIHAEPKNQSLEIEMAGCNLPDYTNIQASDETAKNFGVTLKKLPGPAVPPRSELTVVSGTTKVATEEQALSIN